MLSAVLQLVESMVLSPIVQEQAWKIIKPHIVAGTKPTDAEMTQAWEAASAAHEAYMKAKALT